MFVHGGELGEWGEGGGGEQHVQNAARSLPGRKDWGPGVGGDTVMQEEGPQV